EVARPAALSGFQVKVIRLAATFIDEVLAEVQVVLLAGDTRQLDERQLDLFVAAVATLLPGAAAENRIDVVGVAAHHVEERALARRLIMGDAGFDEMPGA